MSYSKILLTFLISLIVFPTILLGQEVKCKTLRRNQFMTPRLQSESPTLRLTSYLEALMELNILTLLDLEPFLRGLEKGKVINPLNQPYRSAFPERQIHFEGIENIIGSQKKLDIEDLVAWTRRKLHREKKKEREKKVAVKETKSTFTRMKFITIPKGSYHRPSYYRTGEAYDIKWADPVILSNTHVTQLQWSLVMHENPSHHVEGIHSTVKRIKGKDIKMQPDHPVENMDWHEVQIFLQRLNELVKKEDPIIYEIIEDHQPGREYRLPFVGEWQLTASHAMETLAHFKDQAILDQYVWNRNNSSEITHEVGTSKAVMIGNKPIWDIFGNVDHWMADGFYNNPGTEMSLARTNPIGLQQPDRGKSIMGGGFLTALADFRKYTTDEMKNDMPDWKGKYKGFRLAVEMGIKPRRSMNNDGPNPTLEVEPAPQKREANPPPTKTSKQTKQKKEPETITEEQAMDDMFESMFP